MGRFQKELQCCSQRSVDFFGAANESAYIVLLLGALGVEEAFGDVLIEHIHWIVHLDVEMSDDRDDHVFAIRDRLA